MSLVVAIKEKGRIILGSDKQVSTGFNKGHDATKIWRCNEYYGALFGSVGSVRAAQLIQYNKIIDFNDLSINGADTAYIINSLIPNIVSCLQSNGICCISGEDKENSNLVLPNAFLFAFEDRAWMIWNDLSVTEVTSYIAIGSGSDVANGALFATKNKNPFDRIVTAINAAAETTLFVDNGVDLLSTCVLPKDTEQIKAALKIEDKPEAKKVTKKKTTKAKKSTTKNKKPVVEDNKN